MDEILKSKGWKQQLGDWRHPSHYNVWITFDEQARYISLEAKHDEGFACVDVVCEDTEDMKRRLLCLLEFLGQ